jgi:hypothetical protein
VINITDDLELTGLEQREIQKIERNIQGNDVRYYEGEYLCREHYEEKRELETS